VREGTIPCRTRSFRRSSNTTWWCPITVVVGRQHCGGTQQPVYVLTPTGPQWIHGKLEVQGRGLTWGIYLRHHNKCLSDHEADNLSRLRKNALCRGRQKSSNNAKDGWSTVAEKKGGHSVECLVQLNNNDVCEHWWHLQMGIKGKYPWSNCLSSTLLLSIVLECLGELEKESVTMVKAFTSLHCYSQGITVQSKGIPALGTLGLV
jgi:hypothetical protein